MSASRRRVCFTLSVDPDRLDEYRTRHAEVWPDMLAAFFSGGRADHQMHVLEEVFSLEDQLARARRHTNPR